jgi:cell division transport system permease protein
VLSAEELAALTGPWVGRAAEALGPAPELLIDVTLDGPQPDAREMQRRLDVTAPGAAWDDHAAWRAPLAEAAAGFRRLAFWSVGLMGAALAAMVTLAARASLSGAAATVSTLRLIGARDGFVARAFDRPIALRALVGGAVGSAAAAGALVAAPPLGLAESLGVALGVYRPSVILAVAAPIASAVLAYATARAAILVMLRSAP